MPAYESIDPRSIRSYENMPHCSGREFEIRIQRGGLVFCSWWTPEVGDVCCEMCGQCPGWRTDQVPSTCTNGNPWCG